MDNAITVFNLPEIAAKEDQDGFSKVMYGLMAKLSEAELNRLTARKALERSEVYQKSVEADLELKKASDALEVARALLLPKFLENGVVELEFKDVRFVVKESAGAVKIKDEDGLKAAFPEFFNEKTTVSPDKKKIGGAIKEGIVPAEYATIEKTITLNIERND